MSKTSLEAAAEAAARVNAMLIAKGKLKLSQNQIKPKIGHIASERFTDDLITTEVEINDAPLGARNLLTRGHTQDEICKYSGAAISTRGRYMTFDDKLQNITGDRALYLHVQAPEKESVNLAVSRILEMIAQYDKTAAIQIPITNISPVLSKQSTDSCITLTPVLHCGMHFVQEKVFIGLEAPSNFPVREKILGPGESYLQHIKTETGSNVTLRGRGSGNMEPTSGREAFEPLYIHLTHPKPEGLQAAKVLALNLVDTVHAEYSQWQQQQQQALLSIPLTPTHITYQSQALITQPSLNNAGQILPLSMPHLEVQNFPIVVSSAPMLTPILNSTPESMLPSNLRNLPFQSDFMNNHNLPINPVSSLNSIQPMLNNPILSSPPFTNSIDRLVNHLPSMIMPNVPSSMIQQPSIMTSMQTNIPVFPQSQIMEPEFHPPPMIQMHPFNPNIRSTHTAPESIMFPPLNRPSIMPNPELPMYPNPNCVKLEDDSLNNKRKFMEHPDSFHNNGLQDQQYCRDPRPPHRMPLPSPAFPRVHFREPRPLPPLCNKRDISSLLEKSEVNVDKVPCGTKTLKKEEVKVEAKENKGALVGIAMIYGSDDSDDDVSSTSNEEKTLNLRNVPHS